MKLSKTAEKILLEAYKQANGEEFDISPKALNVSNDEFNRAVEELESGNNDKEIIYLQTVDKTGFPLKMRKTRLIFVKAKLYKIRNKI